VVDAPTWREKQQRTRGEGPEDILVVEIVRIQRRRGCSSGLCREKLGYDGVYLGGKLSKLRKGIYQIHSLCAWGECIPGGTDYERTNLVWTQPPPPPYQFLQN
jgi:hypothetical protein